MQTVKILSTKEQTIQNDEHQIYLSSMENDRDRILFENIDPSNMFIEVHSYLIKKFRLNDGSIEYIVGLDQFSEKLLNLLEIKTENMCVDNNSHYIHLYAKISQLKKLLKDAYDEIFKLKCIRHPKDNDNRWNLLEKVKL